jgi:translation initiation factor 2 subunit 1
LFFWWFSDAFRVFVAARARWGRGTGCACSKRWTSPFPRLTPPPPVRPQTTTPNANDTTKHREKGYIDLSKRRVSPEEAAAAEDRYGRAKVVHAILRTVADAHGLGLEALYAAVGWPAYRAYGHAFDAFRDMVSDPAAVLARLASSGAGGGGAGDAVASLAQPVKDTLIAAARRRLTPQPVKVRADVELTCFAFDGVLKIQEAMRAAEAAGSEACPVKMRLVAPPLYVLTTATLDKAAGVAALTAATEAAAAAAAAAGGRLVVREAARAVSERDDRLLTDHMAALASANREVAGDDDVSDEDEGMGDLPA